MFAGKLEPEQGLFSKVQDSTKPTTAVSPTKKGLRRTARAALLRTATARSQKGTAKSQLAIVERPNLPVLSQSHRVLTLQHRRRVAQANRTQVRARRFPNTYLSPARERRSCGRRSIVSASKSRNPDVPNGRVRLQERFQLARSSWRFHQPFRCD